jgi:SAM-dependent methyltransferase
LELGPLVSPWRVPASATVAYLDRLPTDQLRRYYNSLPPDEFAPVHIVDDAETLLTVPSSSQDFVMASHILEHCEDPIAALAAWLRVLKPGGVLLLAVPDKRFTFDRERPVTTFAHLLEDHQYGPGLSRECHYVEWVTRVDHATPDTVEARVQDLMHNQYSIHFHVWDHAALGELLAFAIGRSPRLVTMAAYQRNRAENLAVLRVTPSASTASPA